MEPWLAESGEWTGDLSYQATLRDGITWSDGEQLTAEDVKYTVELGQLDGVPYSNVWDWLESVEVVDDLTVEFTFLEARHQEWDNFLFNTTIVPEHVFSEYSEDDIVTGANEDPVVSGPTPSTATTRTGSPGSSATTGGPPKRSAWRSSRPTSSTSSTPATRSPSTC
ncbi:hypothetical protein GCM10029992_30370 [Glycomyces albus]